MSLAVLSSQALYGVHGFEVRVEVHVGAGLPSFNLVGLPDTGVRESRERVRSALISSGYEFPAGRITVNLAPADLPKESGRFDLPIALGVLAASGQIAQISEQDKGSSLPSDFRNYVFAGELSLTGAVVAVAAPLAIALSVARSRPGSCLMLPADCAALAAHVPNLQVVAVRHLSEVVDHFCGSAPLDTLAPRPLEKKEEKHACMTDVRGQTGARRVMEIAACGGHSLLMSGPPGSGKSMLAHRLPGLLPALTDQQVLDVAAVASVGGKEPQLSRYPPFRTPHHSASMPALVGGGVRPKPGEISLAHLGVLFLDELPEYQRHVLESLREPMELGSVSIARASSTMQFPAQFQLIAAMNPCPCGWLGHPRMRCVCTPDRIEKYRSRLSGPLLDRIDLQISLPPVDTDWLDAPPGEASAVIRERVIKARKRQMRRQSHLNAKLDVNAIEQHCALSNEARALIHNAMQRWSWSARVVHRILRVARTLADMQGQDEIAAPHIAEACQYRQPWGR